MTAAVLDQRVAHLTGALQDVAWVRRSVAEWLEAWSLADLNDDVELVASELTTNAILHAGGAIDLVLERRGRGVRVVVHDRRPDVLPAAPVAAPLDMAGDDDLDRLARSLHERTTTGRGLLLVQAFADAWGIDVGATGKRVWAELGTGCPPHRPAVGQASSLAAKAGPAVLLRGVPVRLVLLSAANMDDLVRELQTTDFATAAAADLAVLAEQLARATSAHREPLRAAARAALQRREPMIGLDLVVPRAEVTDLQSFLELTGQVDGLCRAGVLISGAPAAEVTAFRHWYVDELERQLSGLAPSACPFAA